MRGSCKRSKCSSNVAVSDQKKPLHRGISRSGGVMVGLAGFEPTDGGGVMVTGI
jgi:hypothetical protein